MTETLTETPTETDDLAEIFGDVIHAYTAEQSVADGVNLLPFPESAAEAGFHIPVILTKAAFEETVQWTRGGGWQSEDARFWDVLATCRAAAKASLQTGQPKGFRVHRIPNTTKSGAVSKSESATVVQLKVQAQGFDLSGTPCIIISLPNED